MKPVLKLFLLSSLIGLSLGACGKQDSSPSEEKETQQPGSILFESDQSKSELTASKTAFLQTQPISQPNTGRPDFNLNTVRIHDQPQSPVVHSYGIVSASVPLSASFPKVFRLNIPKTIRDEITRYNITSLDILFTPQLEAKDLAGRAPDSSLKAQWWMFPNRPSLNSIVGAPPQFQKTIQLGIFDSDYPIDDQVKSNQLLPFRVSLHDGLVSPDTGHLNVMSIPEKSFSFYSLAFYPEKNRAAVTLHWILTNTDRDQLVDALVKTQNGLIPNHLDSLMHELDVPGGSFYNTNLLNKLKELTRP
jgi:hypothetical protein